MHTVAAAIEIENGNFIGMQLVELSMEQGDIIFQLCQRNENVPHFGDAFPLGFHNFYFLLFFCEFCFFFLLAYGTFGLF